MRIELTRYLAAEPGTVEGVASIGMPVLLLIVACLLLAANRAPKLAGALLFVAGTGMAGTQLAGALATATASAINGLIDAATAAAA